MMNEKDQRIAAFTTRDAMGAFDRPRGKVEAYAKLDAARPSGPLRGRGRSYTYYDLLRVGVACHIEGVYGVYPHHLSRYTSQISDERLLRSDDELIRFRELDGVPHLPDVTSAGGTVDAYRTAGSRPGLTIDLTPIREQLDRYLLDQYGKGQGGQ
jgi:hypothetical protein